MKDKHRKGDGNRVLRHFSEVYYQDQKNRDGVRETPFLEHQPGDDGKTEFVIYCARCHSGLCQWMTIGRSMVKKENIILVEPCPYCMGERE